MRTSGSCGFPVYPRVGGGTKGRELATAASRGLSPRGRGNRREAEMIERSIRSIPAWAGEPASECLVSRVFAVYPRVGGGTH